MSVSAVYRYIQICILREVGVGKERKEKMDAERNVARVCRSCTFHKYGWRSHFIVCEAVCPTPGSLDSRTRRHS